ncbi:MULTISPECIES: translation elongation factor Ts [Clostridium]|uniref:Elongation factor Ts n=1 Tax=Clostridium novyi (strain NT) TaxID=386415 RepID=EFTS_CLONN|nr:MULTISPECIES: translation elongation factor Ts [Clostridium]A0Q0R9.1 RecName: Full=Elongation factor Ts; Short=EF-Ts [Clostridium novyi NT]ABK61927.1 translation elongation factor Ts [Clostridium novyi NT]KEH88596.1 elongation factor Ts [Clostridium novyi A str. NCTC 538]KEH90698.1 elongation factor Ts [Clostridium novyi A str. BKT29909]KEH94492.1 elongation factor Ts [Clostridium botulinum C/D str. It1]
MVTAKMVKELRERTGAGMMDCKKALTETDGDMEKAVEFLREKGLAAAAKKAGRVAAEGLVTTYLSEDNKTAVALEVNCETDFVSINESFVEFTNSIAKQIATSDVKDVEELLESKYIADENVTVKEALTALIAKIGENMNIRRFEKLTIDNGVINGYVHGEGRIGVLVELGCEKESDILMPLAKDIAMQVAAANPLFLDETSVDEEALDKEREIYRAQALNEGKPEKIVEKMVEGRVKKYLKEVCLIDQVWVKNSDYTIKKLLEEKSKEVGSPITLCKFVRFERGEGLEKKEENFAEEVQRQMNQK